LTACALFGDSAVKIDIEKFKKSRQGIEIDGVSKALNEITKASINELPEQLFVNHFLPLFLGEVPQDTNLLQTWFGIAGNPYMPVNVTGNNGEILYTVPAFFEREAITLDNADSNATSFTDIIATTEQLSHLHPKRAERYFEDQMNRRNIVKDGNPLVARNIKIWAEICERYNKKLPEYMQKIKSTEVTVSENTQDTNKRKDDLEYDSDVF
jgi:hypothetical protein